MNIGEKIFLQEVNATENQFSVGKCMAMAICTYLENEIFLATGNKIDLSYDYIYANRKDTDYQNEELYLHQALPNITESGIALESEFSVPNVKYPLIKTYFDKLTQDTHDKAKKYCFTFDSHLIRSLDALERCIELLNQGHMIISIVSDIQNGHAVVLNGIERLSGTEYKYYFINSWGEGQNLEYVGDRYFLYNRSECHYPEITNIDILNNEPIEPVAVLQIDSEYIKMGNDLIRMTGIDSNGNVVPTPTKLIDSRTYVPLAQLSRLLGKRVEWIHETKQIKIYEK